MSETEQEQTQEPVEEPVEPVEEQDEPGEPEPDDEPGEPEEEPEARVEPSHDELVLERRRADAEKKWKRHETGVRAIFQEESEYLFRCPLCPDQHPGLIDIRFAGQVPEELADAVTAFLRGAEQVKYQQDPDVQRCPRCAGLGKTDTASRVPGKDLIMCKVCRGFGYYPPPGTPDNGRADEAPALVAVGADAEPLVNEDLDIWQSPRLLEDGRENPNYGKMPQYKDPRLP